MNMKSTMAAAAAAVLMSAAAASAQPAGAGTTTGGNHVCLWTYQIDHTHYVNPTTVLFYMKDGRVWQNNLKGPCPGLNLHGFSYVTRSDQICGPEIGIRVIKTGEACSLGEFSPYAGEQHASR
ncbi:MAG: hypothetical protein JOY77_00630 [Alphaproteobacteria bacterium]|nr:hypothetical protein [Alphaproteobacteria bacterium]MBV9061420.1 hypothetical protein [Alphaproteobacteria bacterium]